MDRLERLVNLVAALLDTARPLTREELRERVGGYAEELNAFRRNFERDKDLLRSMGMPLVVEPVDPSRPDGPAGYRIPRARYELTDPGLTDDELAALHRAAEAVDIQGSWGPTAVTSALWKLSGASAPDRRDGGHGRAAPGAGGPGGLPGGVPLGGDGSVAELPAGEAVAVAFGALAERRRLRFDYRGGPRTVDPWRLSFRNGQWYLAGYDHDRRDGRTFRLDRISGTPQAVGPPGAYERPSTVAAPAPPWLLGDEEEITAEVLVDASQAAWAVAAAGPDAEVDHGADGSVVLRLRVTSRDGLRSFVLGFLDHAEILGPEELRQGMIRWLEGVGTAGPGGTA